MSDSLDAVVLPTMIALRGEGWLVELKCIPPECGWVIQGARSEYDAPCADRTIGHGKWYCNASYMRKPWRHSQWAMDDTPEAAVKRVAEYCRQNNALHVQTGREAGGL